MTLSTTLYNFSSHNQSWLLATTVLGATLGAYLINKHHFAPLPGVPGPPPEFLIGNLRNVLLKYKTVWNTWQNIKSYGPIVAVWLGPKRIIWINDPDLAAEITRNKEIFDIDPFYTEMFQSLIPHTMLAISGDVWKRHRRAMQPVLSTPRLKYIMNKMNRVINVTIDKFRDRLRETDQPIDIGDELEDTALDIMGYLAFGHAFRDIDGEELINRQHIDLSAMKNAIKVLTAEMTSRPLSLGVYKIFGDSKRVQNAKNELNKVVKILMDEYELNRQKLNNNEIKQSEWDAFMNKSFVASIFSSAEGQCFTFDEIRGEMITLIIAGSDTLSATMGYAIKLLSNNPRVQQKLYEEIMATIGKDAEPNYEQLKQNAMPYLDNVVKEIQRLSLVLSKLIRCAKKDVVLNGKFFPKGTGFWTAISSMHRDPRYWKDPELFLPERWDEDGIANGGPINPAAFMPFGSGPRMCYGYRLAILELKLFLVKLTRSYFFKELPRHLADYVGEEQIVQTAVTSLKNVVALPIPRQY